MIGTLQTKPRGTFTALINTVTTKHQQMYANRKAGKLYKKMLTPGAYGFYMLALDAGQINFTISLHMLNFSAHKFLGQIF